MFSLLKALEDSGFSIISQESTPSNNVKSHKAIRVTNILLDNDTFAEPVTLDFESIGLTEDEYDDDMDLSGDICEALTEGEEIDGVVCDCDYTIISM